MSHENPCAPTYLSHLYSNDYVIGSHVYYSRELSHYLFGNDNSSGLERKKTLLVHTCMPFVKVLLYLADLLYTYTRCMCMIRIELMLIVILVFSY